MNNLHFIINSQAVRTRAASAVMAIRGDDDMEVIIRKREYDKTKEQRGWFHALCKIFGEETGYTQGEIKELVKAEVLGTTIITIAGREREVTASSEKQNRESYSELIEGCYRLAAEAGIQLPNPRWQE